MIRLIRRDPHERRKGRPRGIEPPVSVGRDEVGQAEDAGKAKPENQGRERERTAHKTNPAITQVSAPADVHYIPREEVMSRLTVASTLSDLLSRSAPDGCNGSRDVRLRCHTLA